VLHLPGMFVVLRVFGMFVLVKLFASMAH